MQFQVAPVYVVLILYMDKYPLTFDFDKTNVLSMSTDLDECVLDPPVCLPNTLCVNIQGSYKCIPLKKTLNSDKGQCPPGFAKNLLDNACDGKS